MAWTEKLPSGRHRGLYRLPNGERRSAGTFAHKKAARDAAIEAEGKVKAVNWRDPRAGATTWREWHSIWWPSRSIEPQTRAGESNMVAIHLMPHWGDVPLNAITKHSVQAWATSILSENIGTEESPRYRAPATARRIMNVLVSSLTAAVDAELLTANPATRIKLPPARTGHQTFLTREQYAALAQEIPTRADRALLDFLVGTGLRWGEVAGLHLNRLDLQRGFVTVADVTDGTEIKPYPKGRRIRYVPLLQWVVDHLDVPEPRPCGLPHRTRDRRCTSGLVFPAPRGGVRDDRNFTQRVLNPALKRAGLADLGFSLHDLRHTYASWLAQDGIPLGRISELLGHASVTTTEIYAHFTTPSADDLRLALRSPHGANVGQASALLPFTTIHGNTPN